MLRSLRYQYLTVLWTGVVLILCNIPYNQSESSFFFDGFDKLVHTGFFFVLTVLLFYGKIRQQKSYSYRYITIFKIIVVTALVGGAIELLQLMVFTYRSAEWWDLFADMTGVLMGIFSYILLHRMHLNEKPA